MAIEKLCVFCANFGWEELGYIYYSTLTGGELTGGLYCKKGRLPSWEQPKDTEEFREMILTAEKCPDYTPPV